MLSFDLGAIFEDFDFQAIIDAIMGFFDQIIAFFQGLFGSDEA